MAGSVIAVLFVLGIFGLVMAKLVSNLYCVSSPNEVIVFSGPTRKVPGGATVGYITIGGGGSRFRRPFFEAVDRVELTNMTIDVSVQGAYSKGGIPLNVQGVAIVKIAPTSPALDNALQRFLGRKREQVMEIAKETLEGNLRGVLATMTPEEVNQDKTKFLRSLQEEAAEGLRRLGLVLDTLKIQNVSDDAGYLSSLGRKQSAEVTKKARIAEAQTKSQSAVQSAENKRQAELVRLEQELQVARADAERRIKNAETAQQAMVAEEQGEVQALVAKARAELGLQEARLEQVKQKLEAEVVQPARAQCEATVSKARGDAAKILEGGRAQADALKKLATQWRSMGDRARELFLLQKLDQILPVYLGCVKNLRIDKIAFVQGGGNGAGELPQKLVAGFEALRAGAGVDVAKVLERWAGGQGAASSGAPELPNVEIFPTTPEPPAPPKTRRAK